MKDDSRKYSSLPRLFLRPRFGGSYLAILYGLTVAVYGQMKSHFVLSSVGELVLYGSLLYQARKRQYYSDHLAWPAIELYAGLSYLWMMVNIVRTQVWQWHPFAFGLTPAALVGIYLVALLGQPIKAKAKGQPPRRPRRIALMVATGAFWAVLNIYVLPTLDVVT
jgi:hypothetical protein